MTTTYGTEETITVADLTVGDWIAVIPTQHHVRGIKVDSGVTELTDGDGWGRSNGRGRRRTVIASRNIDTRRGRLNIPSHFTVVVRREVQA